MSGMKFLAGLLLDQIGDPIGSPQTRFITQRLRSGLEAHSDLFQLGWLKSRFATGSPRLFERLGSVFFPRLVPPADGLPMYLQLPCDLGLAEAPVEEFGGLQPSLLQLVKITFNTFGISHAPRLPQRFGRVTILYDY